VVNYSSIQKIYIPLKNDLIKIYPNPAHKKIIVTGNIPRFTELTLFDLTGKLLLKNKIITNQNNIEIDLPDLSGGIYILKVGDAIKRLVIH